MAKRPLQIVPVIPLLANAGGAAFAAEAPTGLLTYHGGPLLSAVEVVPIFWGGAWEQMPLRDLIVQVNQFFDFILTSSLIDLLAEYSVPGNEIGHGRRIDTVIIPSSEPGGGSGQVTDAQIRRALRKWLADGVIPPATSNTLYFVYLPPGVTSHLRNSLSCVPGGFCGYHSHIDRTVFYAVEPFITCNGCNFGASILDSLTKVSSHELCEAITDPALNGWYDDSSGEEIGDICNRGVQELGGFTIQTEWSNQGQACRVAPALQPVASAALAQAEHAHPE